MSKIAIFASGEGSNAAQLIHYFSKRNDDLTVSLLVCNRKNAGVYKVGEVNQVPVFYSSNESLLDGKELTAKLKSLEITWIVLAGFLRKIPPLILQSFPNRIFNIHPSLLPKYGGAGMYGNKVHEAVIANREVESGISIHLVNEEYDQGKILFQTSCKLNSKMTVEELATAIHNLEHAYFAPVIEKYILEENHGN